VRKGVRKLPLNDSLFVLPEFNKTKDHKMKKLLMIAVLGLPMFALMGCSSESTVVEATSEEDGSMTAEQQKEYEEQMRSGQGMSSRPGN
jgi:hypothetical protein